MTKATRIIKSEPTHNWNPHGMEMNPRVVGRYVWASSFNKIITGLCAEIEALKKANKSAYISGIFAGSDRNSD